MRAHVGGAVLLIVAETMTPKAFSQRTSRGGSKCIRARECSSGGGEDVSAVRELNVLSCIPRDGESSVVWVG